MDIKIIYEDADVLIVDKPAGLVVFPEGAVTEKTLIDYLIEQFPALKNAGEAPRYGVVHRLDKDTSGVLLVAKTTEALIFLQKQFKNREVEKKYIALASGALKEDSGAIETLMGRSPSDPRKQKCYQLEEEGTGRRLAVTKYAVAQRFEKFTLLDVDISTGRKHQIRAHLAYIHHPIAGDTLYGFKDSPQIEGLKRQFLHAASLKIQLPACAGRPSGGMKEFNSPLPDDLQNALSIL